MKLCFILLLLSFSTYSISQTAILIVRTPDSLFVGADSRVAYGDYKKYDTVCKIIPFKSFYFTFAGFSFEDSLPTMKKYFKRAKNIEQAASAVMKNRYSELVAKLTLYWRDYNSFYINNFSKHKYSEIVFFGVEKKRIVMRQVYFKIISQPNEPPKIDTGNLDMPWMNGRQKLIHTAGHDDVIDANLGKSEIWDHGIASAIEKLITLQSRATPENVALPIDIIVLTINGVKWICPMGRCYLKYKKKKAPRYASIYRFGAH